MDYQYYWVLGIWRLALFGIMAIWIMWFNHGMWYCCDYPVWLQEFRVVPGIKYFDMSSLVVRIPFGPYRGHYQLFTGLGYFYIFTWIPSGCGQWLYNAGGYDRNMPVWLQPPSTRDACTSEWLWCSFCGLDRHVDLLQRGCDRPLVVSCRPGIDVLARICWLSGSLPSVVVSASHVA